MPKDKMKQIQFKISETEYAALHAISIGKSPTAMAKSIVLGLIRNNHASGKVESLEPSRLPSQLDSPVPSYIECPENDDSEGKLMSELEKILSEPGPFEIEARKTPNSVLGYIFKHKGDALDGDGLSLSPDVLADSLSIPVESVVEAIRQLLDDYVIQKIIGDDESHYIARGRLRSELEATINREKLL